MSVGQEGFPGGILVQQHIATAGSAPTAAAGANNGASPPAPIVNAASNDTRGSLTFGSGTTPAAGAQVVVTFATPYANANYTVQLEPTNSALALLGQAYVTTKTAAAFTINTPIPAASQAATVYAIDYQVIG